MNVDNTAVQMRKGILEFCVLHIIARGEVYASDLIEELTTARMVIVEGTLYPLLTRLKNAGLLDYKWVESSAGPPRKYYTLTPQGREFLSGLDQTWQEITESIRLITERNASPSAGDTQRTALDVSPAPEQTSTTPESDNL